MPDELYRAAKELAARKEWSLAEIVRRGLETILAHYPEPEQPQSEWKLPEPRPLGADAFFENPDWRYEINQSHGVISEPKSRYKSGKKKGS
ncbi:MAG TPA: antitoxin [Verrucomicrobia bacterium]|nr:MAG: hypothetical protein A2X46_16850 [Lentisphaerae bacterium GWF2_57_35]HBA82599.1 antitoxin [Verrucomicrobiota bacterium]